MYAFAVSIIAMVVFAQSTSAIELRRLRRAADARFCFQRSAVVNKPLDYLEDNVSIISKPAVSSETDCAQKCLNAKNDLGQQCQSYRYDATSGQTTCTLRASHVQSSKVQWIQSPIFVYYGEYRGSCNM